MRNLYQKITTNAQLLSNWSILSKGGSKVKKDNKREDSRIIRSKRDLADALEKLLQEKNLDDITITEIAEEAMVSKNTFYNNFLDKNELTMFLFSRYEKELFEKINPLIDTKKSKEELFESAMGIIVHFFYENPIRIQRMVKNDRSKSLYWIINDFIKTVTKTVFENYAEILSSDVPLEIVSLFYSGAFANIIYFASLDDFPIEEEDCVKYMLSLIKIPAKED